MQLNSRSFRASVRFTAVALAAWAASVAGAANVATGNLLVNPGAESGISGWTEISGNWGTRSGDPAPFAGARYFFAGEDTGADDVLGQTVSVPAAWVITSWPGGSEVDKGKVSMFLSTWARSFPQDPPDIARLAYHMLDATQNANCNPCSASDFIRRDTRDNGGDSSAWTPVGFFGAAPLLEPGTRRVAVRLEPEHNSGTNNDGYFDNAVLELLLQNQAPMCSVDAHATSILFAGQPFSMTFTGTDADPDFLLFSALGMPPGATLTTLVNTAGQRFVRFDWTPTFADVGRTFLVRGVFSDNVPQLQQSCSSKVTLTVANRPPTCPPVAPPPPIHVGETVSITIPAIDPDVPFGDSVSILSSALPAGATLSAVPTPSGLNAIVNWTPTAGQVGAHSIVVTFQDRFRAAAKCSVPLMVVDIPPECHPETGIFEIYPEPDETFTLVFQGSDHDPVDTLTISSVSGLPAGATLNPDVGTSGGTLLSTTLSWQPTIADVGQHVVTVVFTDSNGDPDACVVTIIVRNRAPDCEPHDAGTFLVNIGDAFYLPLHGEDPDLGDTLSVSSDSIGPGQEEPSPGLPAGAALSLSGSGRMVDAQFDWTPTVFDVGMHVVNVTFRDSLGVEDACTFTVEVLNRDPFCTPESESFPLNIGEPLAASLLGDDLDPGDHLTVSAAGLPAWMGLAVTEGLAPVAADFSGTPTVFDVGTSLVTVEFQDHNGATSTCGFEVEVVNRNPSCAVELGESVEVVEGTVTVTVGHTFSATFTASDEDPGDELDILDSTLPPGATVDQGGTPPLQAEVEWAPTASDVAGNPHLLSFTFEDINGGTTTCELSLVVNRPPVAVCMAEPAGGGTSGLDITVECDSPSGRAIILDGAASFDPDDDELIFHWDVSDLLVVLDGADMSVASAVFPIGVTMATLTVVDGRGGIDTCDLIVRVQDTMPPEVECTTSLAALWPPKHDMRQVALIVSATDDCQNPDFIFPITVMVRSDEPDNANGLGDGNTTGDVNGMDGYILPADVTTSLSWNALTQRYEGTIQLRSERDGNGDGRCYTLDVVAVDSQGNSATTSCCIVVPHDRRGMSNN